MYSGARGPDILHQALHFAARVRVSAGIFLQDKGQTGLRPLTNDGEGVQAILRTGLQWDRALTVRSPGVSARGSHKRDVEEEGKQTTTANQWVGLSWFCASPGEA